ncbi:MAG TPA: DUF2231 domain-containing protein [Solirubrobacteraceae bacterium]
MARGLPGHPSHPPLTDVSIGAYTVGTALLVLAALGVDEPSLSRAGLLAVSGGLIMAAPTALTGLLDWLALPAGSSVRRVATYHLVVMVSATVVFALAWLLQRPGYHAGDVRAGGWIAALVAEGLLTAGGYLGGTIVFVHGHRVLGESHAAPERALRPDAEPTLTRASHE